MVLVIAELNGPEVWGDDVGNTYLELKPEGKVCSNGAEGFDDFEGQVPVIFASTIPRIPMTPYQNLRVQAKGSRTDLQSSRM